MSHSRGTVFPNLSDVAFDNLCCNNVDVNVFLHVIVCIIIFGYLLSVVCLYLSCVCFASYHHW